MVWLLITALTYCHRIRHAEGDVRESRRLGLLGTMVLLALSAPLAAAAPAPGPPSLPVNYDETVYGDFAMVGNTVTTCPAQPGKYPLKNCLDARNRIGSGVTAQNNGHPMAWVDIDADSSTYNSSSARVQIPPGARVRYAKLTWAGSTGGPANVPCGRDFPKPPGSPQRQAVSVSVNGQSGSAEPARYSEDPPGSLTNTDQQFYSAYADITTQFRGVSDQATVTVGNVWTPQGYDCFGGWSLVVVWAFDGPHARYATARKQVAVYDGHVRVTTGATRADAKVASIKGAGGASRIGVAAFEGDWALSGDRFLVNDRDSGRGDNFFLSEADGRLNPAHVNNMSVDARDTDLAADVIRGGQTGADLTFTSGSDAYLITSVAVSSIRPELVVDTTVDRTVAHVGEDVTQTVTVANVGGAPAVDVRVRGGQARRNGSSCDQDIARLEPGKSAKVSCTRPAEQDDYRPSAEVSGLSLAGDQLAARAATAVEVIRPAIAVSKSASPATVLNGQTVTYQVEVRNTGDSPLSGVAIDDKQVNTCDKADVGELAPGASRSVQCTVVAGDDGFTNTVTVAGTDKAGAPVSSGAQAAFSVVHPKVTLTVQPSTHAARVGDVVTFTVTVANPSKVPLSKVRVTGTPAACERQIGDLAPGKSFVYTCSVRVQERLTSSLAVSAVPEINGQPVSTRVEAVRSTVSVVVSVVPVMPVVTQPVAPKAVVVIPEPPEPKVVVVIVGLAVITTFLSVSVLGAVGRR